MNKWIEEFSRDSTFCAEAKMPVELLKENPEKARDVLVKNVERSIEALKLKI